MNEISECDLIEQAKAAVSDASWAVGECSALLVRRYSRGRTDADFAAMMGLTVEQFYQRRRVYETFADVRAAYPRLYWGHFYAALTWEDAADCLKWANDVQAHVPEMRAWRRAQHGSDLSE